MDKANLRARSLSGAMWSMIDSLGQQILSLATFVILGRLLSPALFGVVSTSLVLVFLMRSTILNAISSSLVAAKSPDDQAYDTAFWLLVLVSTAFLLLLWVLAGPIARLYSIDSFEVAIRAFSVLILLFGLSYAHQGWARKHFMFKALAIRNIIGVAVGGLVGLGFAIIGYGLTALIINQMVGALVSLALLWIFVPWRPKLSFDRQWARWILVNAAPLGGTQALQYAAQNLDTAVVTFVAGPLAGGLYGAAKRIALALQLSVWQPLTAVSLPAFAEVADNDPRLPSMVLRSSAIIMAVSAPAFLGVSALAQPLMLALFGPKWVEAAPVLQVLAAFSLLGPSSGLMQTLAFSRGMRKTLLLSVFVQVVIAFTLALNMRNQSTTIIASALSAPSLIGFVILVVPVLRNTRTSLVSYLSSVTHPLAAAGVMYAVVAHLPLGPINPWAWLMIGAAVGLTVYVPVIFVLSRSTFADVLLMLQDVLSPLMRVAGRGLSRT